MAVREARKYPGGNGKVGAIGGSAGGSHDVYLAATGTKGDDRLDAAVAFSGAYDFTDKGSLGLQHFWRIVENYVGSIQPGRFAQGVTDYLRRCVSRASLRRRFG